MFESKKDAKLLLTKEGQGEGVQAAWGIGAIALQCTVNRMANDLWSRLMLCTTGNESISYVRESIFTLYG